MFIRRNYYLSLSFGIIALFIFFNTSIAKADNYCWCKKNTGGTCWFGGLATQVFSTADQCSTFCNGSNSTAIHFDDHYIDWNKVYVSDGGCLQNYCWCKRDDGLCENHTTYDNGLPITTQVECNGYCATRNWQAVHFDQTYTDYNTKPLSEGGCVKNTVQNPATSNGPVPFSSDTVEKVRAEALVYLSQLPTTNPQAIFGLAIKILMMFMGSIMFALVVYAGFIWMTAQGNSERIEKARNIMIWSALGVAVMLLSYIIVNFVFTSVTIGV